MAIIQIKRRTSSGNGPLTGSSGTIKAGEPLVDLNGGNLYIAKKDKTGSSSNQLSASDYIEYMSKPNAESLMNNKIANLALGSASKRNTGTTNGTVPLIGANNKLPTTIIPDISPVTSVNSKTGAVTITLADLGGVALTTYNSHINNNTHLTANQRSILSNVYTTNFYSNEGASHNSTKAGYESSVIQNGLVMYQFYDTRYLPNQSVYYIGINKDKVLTPTSIIDGGTY